jgi:phosphoribosylformimino-5-aminoimidazole carboxamide ribotide isomerase
MTALGVRRFVYTDISRDGTMTEPNFQAIEELMNDTDAWVVASGGVSSIEHLLRLASLGVEGAIVGKALYEGAIDLREAIAAA